MSYSYDAFGNCTPLLHVYSDAAYNNPFRYRGYYYDIDLNLYYLNSRYYDSFTGRFISADGYISTGQGLLGYNMFAYCNNNPVNFVDHSGKSAKALATFLGWLWTAAFVEPTPMGELVAGAITTAVGVIGLGATVAFGIVAVGEIIKDASQANSKEDVLAAPKLEEKDKTLPAPTPSNGSTYYHVTTPDNAAAIMSSGIMIGSEWEGGYVYAWKTNPSKYAIENSGAHMGVTISFKTNASFVMDTGITDPKVQMYGPIVSTLPGPIVVWDVQIME